MSKAASTNLSRILYLVILPLSPICLVKLSKIISKSNGKSCSFANKDAKAFAEGDPNLLALIDNIDAEAKGSQRGNINGPSRDYSSVNGNSYVDYTASFVANELAEILVSGDGDTDLDLYVYDSNGNLIGKDTDYSDDCYVRWVPAWTGRYTIRIVNRGPVYNRFVILTN